MRHPFRRFSYIMAEQLGMTLREVQEKVSSHEMSEWMAFKLTQDKEWLENYERKDQLAKSRAMTDEERLKAFKNLLGGKSNNGNSK